MKEIVGNIFHQADADAICVTTNGTIKKNGELVMGNGLAKQFAYQFPNLPRVLGTKVKENGNHAYATRIYRGFPEIVSFPTKHYWKNPADLNLIERSAKELVDLANKEGWKLVVLPRPGCGLGQLDWKTVKAVIEPILDDRFYVIVPK